MLDGIIPSIALESHIGILGKTGSGKSTAAKVIAEHLMTKGERICALDPTGTYWGLRLDVGGQKKSRFAPVIFGGDHGDIPISRQHGALLGEAIGTSADSAIIDTQQMKVSERVEFATEFAEALLRSNRGPLHLIVDEAHLFAPQGKVNDPQSGKMVHAFNNLVSLGRGRGLRIILISQRPAKLHKDSLTQVETLVAMRLIAPQDRAAIRNWVGEWADKAKGDEIIASLPSLPVGDAWVWAPQLDYLERKHFPLATTYDSGTAQANAAARELPPIDTAKLGEKMDTIRQQAMENDPKRLKAQIADLLREKAQARPATDEKDVSAAYEDGRLDGYHAGHDEGYAAGVTAQRDWSVTAVSQAFKELLPMVEATVATPVHTQQKAAPIPTPVRTETPKVQTAAKPPQIVAHANGFSGPQMKVLASLSMWKALGHDTPTKPMVAMCAGYSHTSGGFGNLLSQLNTTGAIEYPQAGKIRLLADVGTGSPTSARDALIGRLSNPQRKIIDALHDGGEMSKTYLGAATEYSPTSGGFGNLLSQLRSLGLIDYPSTGRIALEPWLAEIL